MALINKLNNLGDAVRERSGLEQELTLDEMAEVVRNIPQPDLSSYATKEYVDEKIDNLDIPGADMSDYYNREETEEVAERTVARMLDPIAVLGDGLINFAYGPINPVEPEGNINVIPASYDGGGNMEINAVEKESNFDEPYIIKVNDYVYEDVEVEVNHSEDMLYFPIDSDKVLEVRFFMGDQTYYVEWIEDQVETLTRLVIQQESSSKIRTEAIDIADGLLNEDGSLVIDRRYVERVAEEMVEEMLEDYQTAEQVQAAINTALSAIGIAEEGAY